MYINISKSIHFLNMDCDCESCEAFVFATVA